MAIDYGSPMVPPMAPAGAAAFAGGGFAAGAVSAATGALAAKAVSDRSERRAIEERLAEVKRDLAGLGSGKMGRSYGNTMWNYLMIIWKYM